MSDSLNNAAHRLRWARENAGFKSAKAFAETHGIGVGTYTHHENGTRNFSTESAGRYARLLKISADWLVTGKGQPERKASHADAFVVPIVGTVQAGEYNNYHGLPLEDYPDPVYLPKFMTEPYVPHEGILVKGDSMNLVYPEGSILFVMRIMDYIEAGGELSNGLDIIVHQVNFEGAVESTVKRLQIADNQYWAVPCSTSPVYQSLVLDHPSSWKEENQDYSGKAYVAGVVLSSMQKKASA